MNELIEKLISMGMGRLMDESRDEMAMADKTYKADREAENELEQRYESLDLTREQRIIINDYIACTSTVNHRYSDIAYMCGIKNTVEMLVSLGIDKRYGRKKLKLLDKFYRPAASVMEPDNLIWCTLKDFTELFQSCQCDIFILFEGIQRFVVNPTL